MKYRIISANRGGAPYVGAKVGDIVYNYPGYDYGLCRDDESVTGIEHTKVTFDKDGKEPFFTIPRVDLKILHDLEQ